MRLWTIHPKHLDPAGLVALWREALLAQAVLHGQTKGYTRHPQLQRFREAPDPLGAMCVYLRAVHAEATERGYSFNGDLILGAPCQSLITANEGQLQYEWTHLGTKLALRNPTWKERNYDGIRPSLHPLFTLVPGPVALWERI